MSILFHILCDELVLSVFKYSSAFALKLRLFHHSPATWQFLFLIKKWDNTREIQQRETKLADIWVIDRLKN